MVMIDLNTPYWATHKFHLDSFTDITHAGVMPNWRERTREWMLDFIAYAEKRWGDRIGSYILSDGGTSEWYEYDRGRSSNVKTRGRPDMPQNVKNLLLGAALFYALCDAFRLARFNTMLEQPAIPYWKNFFLGVPAPGGCWMVLTPAILALSFDGGARSVASVAQNPWFGAGMLLFIGVLMASRLPTISLKSVRISRSYLLPTMAGLLLLIA